MLEAESNRKSVIAPLPNKEEQRKTLLAPGATEPNRYSEIFNAYYRQSIAEPAGNDSKGAGMAV